MRSLSCEDNRCAAIYHLIKVFTSPLVNSYFYERGICVGRSDYCTFLSVGLRDWSRCRADWWRRLSPRLFISVYLRCWELDHIDVKEMKRDGLNNDE